MAEIKIKAGFYKCISNNCFHAGRYYEKGEYAYFDAKRLPPLKKNGEINHFEFVGSVKPKDESLPDKKDSVVTGSVDVSSLGTGNSSEQQQNQGDSTDKKQRGFFGNLVSGNSAAGSESNTDIK